MAESKVEQLARETELELALVKKDVEAIRKDIDAANLNQLRERVAVLESQQADARKAKDESDKRQWQFVYIFAGAMASLLVTVVVQLVLSWVKK